MQVLYNVSLFLSDSFTPLADEWVQPAHDVCGFVPDIRDVRSERVSNLVRRLGI